MDLKELAKPFPAEDIEWRVQQAGEKNGKIWAMVLAYVTNRAIQLRLDDVCGPENWQNDYKPAPSGGNLCGISIYIPERKEWVTKWDGADNTNIEATKGGLSDAMKRAGYQWGIGRYLYNLDTGFANIHDKGKIKTKAKINGQDKWFSFDPPSLPSWALPDTPEKPKSGPQSTNATKANPTQGKKKDLAVNEMRGCKKSNPELFDEIAAEMGIKGKTPDQLTIEQCNRFINRFTDKHFGFPND